jgi:hypothetical protein
MDEVEHRGITPVAAAWLGLDTKHASNELIYLERFGVMDRKAEGGRVVHLEVTGPGRWFWETVPRSRKTELEKLYPIRPYIADLPPGGLEAMVRELQRENEQLKALLRQRDLRLPDNGAESAPTVAYRTFTGDQHPQISPHDIPPSHDINLARTMQEPPSEH